MHRCASAFATVGLLILSLVALGQTTQPQPPVVQPPVVQPPVVQPPVIQPAGGQPKAQLAPEQQTIQTLQDRVDKLSQIAGKVPTTEITCGLDLKCTPAEVFISAASVSRITI